MRRNPLNLFPESADSSPRPNLPTLIEEVKPQLKKLCSAPKQDDIHPAWAGA